MSLLETLLFLCIILNAIHSSPSDFDCPMREFLLEYAVNINQDITNKQLQDMADALNGSPLAILYECNVSLPSHINSQNQILHIHHQNTETVNAINTIYVSANSDGNDIRNNGLSILSPLKTIHKAIDHARKLYGPNQFKQILLRNGTYYLGSTVYLNHLDSNLLITSYNNELVNISGAVPLTNLNWKYYATSRIKNEIYSAKIDTNSVNISNIWGLRINGYRGIRARYPNIISQETFPPEQYTLLPKQWHLKSGSGYTVYTVNDPRFVRNNTNPPSFTKYQLEVNGSYFDKFLPPASAPRLDNPYPTGLQFTSDILPNAPYNDVTGGIVRAFQVDHWYSWMWELDNSKTNANNLYFLPSGGNQGSDPGTGDTFFIENVFEELDAINEWIYNISEQTLYFIPNKTNSNDNIWRNYKYETTKLKVLFELQGNQTHPVKNVTLSGMSYIDTVYTYLDAHGDPPGGGWGVQYNAAINLIGTENVTVTNNLFSRLDGLGILVFAYNRYTVISSNEFVWIGDSCVVVWGNTEGYPFAYNSDIRYSKLGINGTNGDQPRFLNVSYNIAHEIGINEKQSSFYFQALSCQNDVSHNIVYNGPRAGILFNDGFGGGNRCHHNIMFNLCRESTDHGPFNSWDHTPYVTKVLNGKESITKAFDRVFNNFLISNYQADYQIDNDDCSQYFQNYNNFLVYGYWAFKNNMGGHDIHHWNNIYAYVQRCIQLYDTKPLPTNTDILVNTTCIINDTAPNGGNQIFDYAFIGPNFSDYDCKDIYPINEGGWKANNNTIMINNGNMENTGYCNVNMNQLQKHGTELDSTVQGWPKTKDILDKARQILMS